MKAAIFDLDGTLLDSMGYWGNVTDKYLSRQGIEVSKEDKEIIDSLTVVKAGEYIKKRFDLPFEPQAIEEGIIKTIESYYRFSIPLKSYVHLFLYKLKKRGVKMCIASASPRPLIENALMRHNIFNMFDFIITSSEVGSEKRNSADIYEKALEKLGEKKEDTVVFEDAPYAVKTAKGAGFFVVGVYDNFYEEYQDEIKNNCDLYVNHLGECKL